MRSGQVAADEIWQRDGIKLTSPARTALDLLCWNPVDAAIAATDALAWATRLKLADVHSLIERYAGRRQIRRAREALKLVDPGSESPRETWLRLLLVRAGFPTPETQIVVRNEYGVVIAVVDMGWDQLKLGLEYEGDHHRTNRRQFNRDIHRYEELREMGWLIIRVTVEDVAGSIIHRVGAGSLADSNATAAMGPDLHRGVTVGATSRKRHKSYAAGEGAAALSRIGHHRLLGGEGGAEIVSGRSR